MSGIQKALTQLKGSIRDHLEDNHRSIYFIVREEGFDINTSCIARNHVQSQQGIITSTMTSCVIIVLVHLEQVITNNFSLFSRVQAMQ